MKRMSFTYNNSVRWTEQKKGLLSCDGKPDIEIATPPEFKGHPGIWSPEDLFVAAVNMCIMTTFLHYIEKENIVIRSYESFAEGILGMANGRLSFSKIKIKPAVLVAKKDDAEEVKRIFEVAEQRCLISNSIKSEVAVVPSIRTDS